MTGLAGKTAQEHPMRMTQEQVDEYNARVRATPREQWPMVVPSTPKRVVNRFLNVKTTDAKGIVHDGKGECERWQELLLLERAGDIGNLRRQVPYAFVVNGILVCQYIADFVYLDGAATIVEDHKSPRTRKLAAYAIKRKLMQALHGIQIREVTK